VCYMMMRDGVIYGTIPLNITVKRINYTVPTNAESETGLCKKRSGPNCILNTNYSEKCN